METKQKITINTLVSAPLEETWTTFITPADVMQWNTASPDWHTPKAENDLRVGGSFSYTMAAKDGSFSFDFGGVYDDVKEKELIAYTLGNGRKVITTFEHSNDGTIVSTTFDPELQNPVEMQRGGWQAILDNFKKYTEHK